MNIAVTGATGFVGSAIVRAAARHGHSVRAVVRHAPDPDQLSRDPSLATIEYHLADVAEADSLTGAFDGVDVVIHAAGIARESDDQTFTAMNVNGTRHVLAECTSAGAPSIIFISSLGADRGASAYHRSKRHAEMLVREYSGAWTILRPGNVYGAEGGEIALLVRLIRTLPVLPIAGNPASPFQPIAADDLAEAVLRCCEMDVSHRILDLAGDEVTSQRDLHRRITQIVHRHPPLVTIPEPLALLAGELLEIAGIRSPVWSDQLLMVREGNVLLDRSRNALRDVLGIQPRSLDDGLRKLARATPEQFPELGSGHVMRRRYWIEIDDCAVGPAELMSILRREFAELMPDAVTEVAPEDNSDYKLVRGATISLALPVRGHVQVRVEEVTTYSVTCVTLEGHPLSGVVRYLTEQRGSRVRFEVQTIDHPRTLPDRAMMALLGTQLKHMTWTTLLHNVVARSAGIAAGEPVLEEETLDDAKTERFRHWVHELVSNRVEQQGYSLHQEPLAR